MSTPSHEVDSSVPHSARVWDYWLGGKENYPADREMGDQIAQVMPSIIDMARHDRGFLRRTVGHMVEKEGVRQFLDIGTGLPTQDNTHEVAQRVAPECKVVYVDNDPLVLAHAHALLTGSPEGVTNYLHADLNDPRGILDGARQTLDFTRPVAVMLLGIVHFVPDLDEARAIIGTLMDACPPGSFLAVSHATDAADGEPMRRAVEDWNAGGAKPPLTLRSPEQIATLFEGLEILEPGVVSTSRWRPDPDPFGEAPLVGHWCALARKTS
ncbi:SAM-dependent methyltransferase [Actinomadura kijaniata]|uniref:SAM-dependent methyltransferase n=1 Tax=Actinomadura kijaniata TaxID=46161 RepID=UPI003F1BE97A